MSEETKNEEDVVDIPKILLLGDSLTQLGWEGWASQLANVYQRRADVINRGMSGYNTDWYLLLNLPRKMVVGKKIALVVIFFGANDASLADLNGRQHVPLDRYAKNLHTLIDQVETCWKPKHIILMGPPPVYHKQRLEYQIQRYGKEKATGELERTNENTGKYSKACQTVAKEASEKYNTTIPFIDLWTEMQKAHEDKEDDWGPAYFYDGLHFSKQGQDFVFQQIMKAIEEHFSSDLQILPDPITKLWCNSSSKGGTTNALKTLGPFHDVLKANMSSLDVVAESDENDKKRKRDDDENAEEKK